MRVKLPPQSLTLILYYVIPGPMRVSSPCGGVGCPTLLVPPEGHPPLRGRRTCPLYSSFGSPVVPFPYFRSLHIPYTVESQSPRISPWDPSCPPFWCRPPRFRVVGVNCILEPGVGLPFHVSLTRSKRKIFLGRLPTLPPTNTS